MHAKHFVSVARRTTSPRVTHRDVAVDEHGEAWVLEHYEEQLYPLGRVISMPEKEALPFYDANEHDAMTEHERTEMYQAWAQYRENLHAGTKPE